jgi:acyl-coenzyme A thioesterase PaaI-like protein
MDNELHIEQLLQRNNMSKNPGVEFADLSPARAVVTMPIDGRHWQPFYYADGHSRVGRP